MQNDLSKKSHPVMVLKKGNENFRENSWKGRKGRGDQEGGGWIMDIYDVSPSIYAPP